jgi:hypothetical protein
MFGGKCGLLAPLGASKFDRSPSTKYSRKDNNVCKMNIDDDSIVVVCCVCEVNELKK